MKRAAAAIISFALLLGACASNPPRDDAYEGDPTRPCELTITIKAEAKKGLRVLGKEADYGETGKPRADAKIKRVDYANLADVAVIIEGPGQHLAYRKDHVEREVTLEINNEGFSHALLVAAFAGVKLSDNDNVVTRAMNDVSRKLPTPARLILKNNRPKPVTIFGSSEYGDVFDKTIGAGESGGVSFVGTGIYELGCDEDESMRAQLIVVDSVYVRNGKSGQSLDFRLPAGDFRVSVYAPRLPVWCADVTITEGVKAELTATLGVNTLPKGK